MKKSKSNKSPETVEQRLDTITKLNGGRITPAAVVDDARDPSSPLHKHFEWDDSIAAQQYRLDQARTLIRTVRCHVEIISDTIATPHYVRDPSAGDKQGYIPIVTARSDHELARDIMRDETARVVAALERARSVADALGMSDEIHRLITQINVIRTRIKDAA